MKINSLFSICAVTAVFLCACGEDVTTPPLPTGCSSSSLYAIRVVQSRLACVSTNAFTNTDEILGAPNARATGPGKTQYGGFLSLGIGGSVTVFMGSCIQDHPGNDLRIYQSVSREAVEVQVSPSDDGPFVSLGFKDCVDSPPFFTGFCEFDLAGSGLTDIRIVKVIDREVITFPGAACDNTGLSPGADIDAIQVLHPAN